MLPGCYQGQKKDGTTYYRASITYQSKHISLGSFKNEQAAHKAYLLAQILLVEKRHFASSPFTEIEHHHRYGRMLSFDKWVCLINLRDSGLYARNPIYLQNRYFLYYLDERTSLKFDVDDLFFYMNHKIMRRQGHLFVADYGMQVNILSRYGIKNYGVPGRDYVFVNKDPFDYRYGNIEIINPYHGVSREFRKGKEAFTTKIHFGSDYIVGKYSTQIEAAVAYNKARDFLRKRGCQKNFPINYIEEIDEMSYAAIYHRVRLRREFVNYFSPSPEP